MLIIIKLFQTDKEMYHKEMHSESTSSTCMKRKSRNGKSATTRKRQKKSLVNELTDTNPRHGCNSSAHYSNNHILMNKQTNSNPVYMNSESSSFAKIENESNFSEENLRDVSIFNPVVEISTGHDILNSNSSKISEK